MNSKKNKLHCWKSFFQCCFKKATTTNGNFEDDSSKCDYIVEKLIIKRVPLSAFRSQYDIYNIVDTTRNFSDTALSSKDDKVKLQTLSTTLESAASLKSKHQSTLHNQVSAVNSQFSKINHEVSSTQNSKVESCTLERSLNENESEISDVQVTISNTKEAVENEHIPDNVFAPRSFPCYKLENASCPSLNQRNPKARSENLEIKKHFQQIKKPKYRPQTPDRLRQVTPNTDFVVAPVEVHYESPNLRSIRKHHKKTEPTIFNRQTTLETTTFERESCRYENESPTEESCAKSENYRDDEAAETTLRWKIIIKHHQPNTSENKNKNSRLFSVENTTQNYKNINPDEECI